MTMTKTTFSKLPIGAEFDYNIDADGHEPTLVKLSETEAFVIAGSGAGLRETIKPTEAVYPTGKTHIPHTMPTDIERAALTMLAKAGYGHYGLTAWRNALVNDPNEMRDIDRWLFEATCSEDTASTWAQWLNANGYNAWRKEYDDRGAFEQIIEGKHAKKMYADYRKGERLSMQSRDDAVLRLAWAVADYRVSGRLDGDQTHSIMGITNVTTSLAAAVCEFHERIQNAIYAKYED